MDFLSLSRGGKFEDAKQPKVGLGRLSLHRAERLGVHADGARRRGRPVRPQRRAGGAHPRRRSARPGSTTPVVVAGGIHTLRAGRSDPRVGRRATSSRAARQSLADPDWFLKMRTGRGAEVRALRASPTTARGSTRCTSRSRASSGTARQLDEPGIAMSSDGRRRLVAPRRRLTRPSGRADAHHHPRRRPGRAVFRAADEAAGSRRTRSP